MEIIIHDEKNILQYKTRDIPYPCNASWRKVEEIADQFVAQFYTSRIGLRMMVGFDDMAAKSHTIDSDIYFDFLLVSNVDGTAWERHIYVYPPKFNDRECGCKSSYKSPSKPTIDLRYYMEKKGYKLQKMSPSFNPSHFLNHKMEFDRKRGCLAYDPLHKLDYYRYDSSGTNLCLIQTPSIERWKKEVESFENNIRDRDIRDIPIGYRVLLFQNEYDYRENDYDPVIIVYYLLILQEDKKWMPVVAVQRKGDEYFYYDSTIDIFMKSNEKDKE